MRFLLSLLVVSAALGSSGCTATSVSPSPSTNNGTSGGGSGTPNIVGQWDGLWLGNIPISLNFTSNSQGNATQQNGSIFSHGTVTVVTLFSTNIVMKIHLVLDGSPGITADYDVNATFLNNQTVMSGTTVSGTQDFRVTKK